MNKNLKDHKGSLAIRTSYTLLIKNQLLGIFSLTPDDMCMSVIPFFLQQKELQATDRVHISSFINITIHSSSTRTMVLFY